MRAADRTNSQADFFDELRSWSRVKLRILEKYLRAYLNKRGGSNRTIYYLDGFAGQGYYGQEGHGIEDGSPVRIARLAQEVKDEGKPYRLICLNTELGRKRCGELQKSLAAFDPELVHVYCGALEEHLPAILAKMQGAPAFCFLDPCGVVGSSPSDIKPLLQRTDTEVLVNLSTPTLYRLTGSANSTAKEARGKVAQLSHTLGDDPTDPSPDWLHMRNTLSSDEWGKWAIRKYMGLMQQFGPHLKYSMAYPVRPKARGGVKYYLTFASRAMDAFPLMTDFICTEEDDQALQAEMAERPLGQMSMFGPVHVSKREARYTKVIDEIHSYGMEHQGVSRKEIIEEFSYRYLGEFRQKDFRFMVDRLVEAKRAGFGSGSVLTAAMWFR